LPLYTALPPLLGWFLATLPDRGHAVVLTAALLALHAMGELAGSFRNVHPATAAGEGRELAMQRETVQALERAGLRRVYDSNIGNRALTFLAAEQVIVSHPYEEIRPRYARAVDGAPEVVWWMPRRSPGLEAHFAALASASRSGP
jgi:hypothetical protein